MQHAHWGLPAYKFGNSSSLIRADAFLRLCGRSLPAKRAGIVCKVGRERNSQNDGCLLYGWRIGCERNVDLGGS